MMWMISFRARFFDTGSFDRIDIIDEHPVVFVAKQKEMFNLGNSGAVDIMVIHSMIRIPDDALTEDQIALF